MQPSGPYNLTLGTAVAVTPQGSVNAYTIVVLSNSSPFACKVATENGTQEWLQAWSAQPYDIADVNASITVTPVLATSSNITAGLLTADWYQPGDNLPGGYPLSLTAQAVAAALAPVNATIASVSAGDQIAVLLPKLTDGTSYQLYSATASAFCTSATDQDSLCGIQLPAPLGLQLFLLPLRIPAPGATVNGQLSLPAPIETIGPIEVVTNVRAGGTSVCDGSVSYTRG